jgi:hypothetical protein
VGGEATRAVAMRGVANKAAVVSFVAELLGGRCFSTPAVLAVPLLGQFLFVYAVDVKPLSLTVGVLAHHHLAIGGTATVAVTRLVGVVLPLTPLQALTGRLLPPLLLGAVVVGTVESPLLQLLLQFFSGLVDERVETLGECHFLLRVRLDLVLEGSDAAVLSLGLGTDLGAAFVSPAVETCEEGLASRVEVEAELFYLSIEGAYLSEEGVGLRRDHVQAVDKIVHVAHPPQSHPVR